MTRNKSFCPSFLPIYSRNIAKDVNLYVCLMFMYVVGQSSRDAPCLVHDSVHVPYGTIKESWPNIQMGCSTANNHTPFGETKQQDRK